MILIIGACVRAPAPDPVERRRTEGAHQRWVGAALGPAELAPPSVEPGPLEAEGPGIVARARLIRAEQAAWNAWPGGGPRLFNDAAALLFEIRVEAAPVAGSGPRPRVAWDPSRTALEVNDQALRIPALGSPEPLLEELLLHGFLEEVWGLEGDLPERMRAAGPFRSAYLPAGETEEGLQGVVAFPLGEHARDHVVALRLTLGLVVDQRPASVRWVFR